MFPYQDIIQGIEQLMAQEIPFLLRLSEEQVSNRRNHQQRTVKMLVGHLIDSASNNQQRLVRLQYAPRCGHSMPDTELRSTTWCTATLRTCNCTSNKYTN